MARITWLIIVLLDIQFLLLIGNLALKFRKAVMTLAGKPAVLVEQSRSIDEGHAAALVTTC
jgi:hypothetical protein